MHLTTLINTFLLTFTIFATTSMGDCGYAIHSRSKGSPVHDLPLLENQCSVKLWSDDGFNGAKILAGCKCRVYHQNNCTGDYDVMEGPQNWYMANPGGWFGPESWFCVKELGNSTSSSLTSAAISTSTACNTTTMV